MRNSGWVWFSPWKKMVLPTVQFVSSVVIDQSPWSGGCLGWPYRRQAGLPQVFRSVCESVHRLGVGWLLYLRQR
ncbi:hypothetical protein D3C80_1830370 [compost metagenome]